MPKNHRMSRRLYPEDQPRGVADILVMRLIVDFLGGWENCDRACRRRKECASPTVACFDWNRALIREMFERLADWPRLDGPREPEELAGPVGDLLD